jgi:hypothetical protein
MAAGERVSGYEIGLDVYDNARTGFPRRLDGDGTCTRGMQVPPGDRVCVQVDD